MITGIIARDQVFQEERFSSILEIRCCNFAFKDAFTSTILAKIFQTNCSFSVKIAPYVKSSISIFQAFFASIHKILILVARLSTRL